MANIANANEEYSTKQLRRVLGKKELISMGIGQIIGSGVFSLTGVAIGYTGRSVILAFLFGALFSLAVTVPSIFAGSAVRLRGGQYTMASILLGERFLYHYLHSRKYFHRYVCIISGRLPACTCAGDTEDSAGSSCIDTIFCY